MALMRHIPSCARRPARTGWTDEERRTIRAARWWSLAELRAAGGPVLPAWLPDALAALLDGSPGVPGVPTHVDE